MSRIIGRSLDPEQVSADEIAPGLRGLFGWLEQVGHHVDVGALHGRYAEAGWHSFEDWAHTERSRLEGLCGHREPAVRYAVAFPG
jgi:hypothetical protein